MANIDVRLDDQVVQQYLQTEGPRKVYNALRSAIRTTTTWAEKREDELMAAATQIPISVFKKVRIKKFILGGSSASAFGAGGSPESGLVWSGYNPIKARFVGKMSQSDGGAWAGAYYFPGAFIAKTPNGLTAIFKRRGKSRPPIVEERVNIPQAEGVAQKVADEAQQELLRRFRAKFSEN